MITKKMLLLPAAGAMMLCVAACQTAQDVPIPDDPQAKEWGTQIKGSYPDWQSTKDMPEGNAEYDALFETPAAPAVPEKPAETLTTVDDGADLTGGEQLQAAPEVSDAPEQQITPKAPVSAVISIKADGATLLNGNAVTQENLKIAITAIGKDHGANSVITIRTLGNVAPASINAVLDMCREAKIGKARFVRHGAAPAPKAPAKAKAVPVRVIVDTAVPATDYVVQKGDSLSAISLKFYKNAGYWKTIVKANPQLKDANRLRPGMKIKVPMLKLVPAGK